MRASEKVWCGSIPTHVWDWDAEKYKEPHSWMYGMHIINKMPADAKCPRCGIDLGKRKKSPG